MTGCYDNSHPVQRTAIDYDFSKYKKKYFLGVRPVSFQLWLRNWFSIDSRVFRKAMRECDTFIFIWDSFKKDFSDFEYIKSKGKKLILIFCGDDVRWFFSQKQEFESLKMAHLTYENDYDYSIAGLNERLIRLRKGEKYADAIFSRRNQAQLELRPYYSWNMMVNTDLFPHNSTQRELNPVIVHAPTSRVIKGTQYVLDAFERLKKENIKFTPVLIENMPREQAMEIYADADILIDQLIGAGGGKLATEGLACGAVVMSHMAYDKYPQNTPFDCPIIDVNHETIYEKLKEIILDFNRRKELASKGREYVLKNLDTGIFCQKVLDIIEDKEIDYDFYPDFFREQFIPESEEALVEYNKWNKYVSDCDWYKATIKPGERAGLIF